MPTPVPPPLPASAPASFEAPRTAQASRPHLRCLWLARDLPFPMDSGDRIFSGRMAISLAQAGVQVRFLAFGDPAAAPAMPADTPLQWRLASGGKRPAWRGLMSPLPFNAAIHRTAGLRALLRQALEEPWDAVVIDQLGSAWALPELLRKRPPGRGLSWNHGEGPPLIYLAHNHEETLWSQMAAQAGGSLARRWASRLNALKVARLERQLARSVQLTCAITDEDAARFAAQAPMVPTLTTAPGYSGPIALPRTIDASLPRRVVLLGSFRWAIKQENLRQFLRIADPVFASRGIGLDVIGDVPDALRAELRSSIRATRLHGFVNDPAPLLAQARLAVVPEVIGGGFKLKLLDYLFGRLPIATVTEAAAGLPAELRAHLLMRDGLDELACVIADSIDDVGRLDRMQRQAFELASSLYRWEDRGQLLRRAIEARMPAGRDTRSRSGR